MLDIGLTPFPELINWETNWVVLVLASPGPITIVITAIFYYVARLRKTRMRAKRYADAFLNELERIKKYLGPSPDDLTRCDDSPADSVRYIASPPIMQPSVKFPRNVYDGFVSSTNITIFGKDLQQKMHIFYTDMEEYEYKTQHNSFSPEFKGVENEINNLRKIRQQLECDVSNFRGRKASLSKFMTDICQNGLQDN